jgi:hypothetical protein
VAVVEMLLVLLVLTEVLPDEDGVTETGGLSVSHTYPRRLAAVMSFKNCNAKKPGAITHQKPTKPKANCLSQVDSQRTIPLASATDSIPLPQFGSCPCQTQQNATAHSHDTPTGCPPSHRWQPAFKMPVTAAV